MASIFSWILSFLTLISGLLPFGGTFADIQANVPCAVEETFEEMDVGAATCTVVFESGEVERDDIFFPNRIIGNSFTLISDFFDITGYYLTGWLCSLDSQIYSPGTSYLIPSSVEPGSQITFTAQWTLIPAAFNEGLYYYLYTAADLFSFASLVNSGSTESNALIVNDIDLNPGLVFSSDGGYVGSSTPKEWVPIAFAGEFNGNIVGKVDSDGSCPVIRGLYSSDSSGMVGGFVAYLGMNGKISSLRIENSFMLCAESLGSFAGDSSGIIDKCSSNAFLAGASSVGGIVGFNNGSIDFSLFDGSVEFVGDEEYALGGIAGSCGEMSALISCCVTGTVLGTDSTSGVLVGDNAGYLDICFAPESAEGETPFIGVVGEIDFDPNTVKALPLADFESGKAAWLLNGSGDEETDKVWTQSDEKLPVLTFDGTVAVYKLTFYVDTDIFDEKYFNGSTDLTAITFGSPTSSDPSLEFSSWSSLPSVMPNEDIDILAVFAPASTKLIADDSSEAVIDDEKEYVYGLNPGLTVEEIKENYLNAVNGSISILPVSGNLCGTGSVILLKDNNNEIIKEYQIVIFGDINGDSFIDTNDATTANKVAALIETLEGIYFFASDINGDGFVDSSDATAFNRAAAFLQVMPQSH